MRKNLILGFVMAALVVFGATSSSALSMDASIEGIYTSSALTTLIEGLVIDGDGNATADLAAGQVVLINIDLDKEFGDLLTLGSTIIFQGDQMSYLGPFVIPPAIFQQAGFGAQPNLGNIGTGGVKGNTPNPNDGTGGDVWIQAAAYGSPGGVDGTGDQTAQIQLAFTITGASGSDFLNFVLGFTMGDEVLDQSSNQVDPTFSSATVNVPEPGTALLMGLGLAGLAAAGRRKS